MLNPCSGKLIVYYLIMLYYYNQWINFERTGRLGYQPKPKQDYCIATSSEEAQEKVSSSASESSPGKHTSRLPHFMVCNNMSLVHYGGICLLNSKSEISLESLLIRAKIQRIQSDILIYITPLFWSKRRQWMVASKKVSFRNVLSWRSSVKIRRVKERRNQVRWINTLKNIQEKINILAVIPTFRTSRSNAIEIALQPSVFSANY